MRNVGVDLPTHAEPTSLGTASSPIRGFDYLPRLLLSLLPISARGMEGLGGGETECMPDSSRHIWFSSYNSSEAKEYCRLCDAWPHNTWCPLPYRAHFPPSGRSKSWYWFADSGEDEEDIQGEVEMKGRENINSQGFPQTSSSRFQFIAWAQAWVLWKSAVSW